MTVEGEARIDPHAPTADRVTGYVARYRRLIEAYGWTPETFAHDYPVAIRIRPTRVRSY